MKKITATFLTLLLVLNAFPILKSSEPLKMIEAEAQTQQNNKLSRHVYLIGWDDDNPYEVLRFENDSLPLRPEFTVSIDGEIVPFGKYKPVFDLGYAAIPLLQILRYANIPYVKEGDVYKFSNNGLSFRLNNNTFEVLRNDKIVHSVQEFRKNMLDEVYVNPRILQTIFYRQFNSEDEGNTWDDSALYDRLRVLKLFSEINPKADIFEANDADRRVFNTLPMEVYLEMRMPENEKDAITDKANEIISGISDSYERIKAVHNWVANYLAYNLDEYNGNYDYVKEYYAKFPNTFESGAMVALETKTGVCTEYGILASQLLRAVGIPARLVLFEDASHLWVEAFDGERWISFDPTWDTTDAIINGELVENYYQNKNKSKHFFDFDFSERTNTKRIEYLIDEDGTHDEVDSTVYANWFWNSPIMTYSDFETGAYWTEHMMWAIDKGLISGYKDVENPSSGDLENLIKPYSKLTEYQFLTILFRYMYPSELLETKPITDFWASVPYQMAKKYRLPTNGSLENQKPASEDITRGKMAQILATLHYKRSITLEEAIYFMYESNLSDGYADENGSYPKTIESFRPNSSLVRAQIVTFIKRYDEFLSRN